MDWGTVTKNLYEVGGYVAFATSFVLVTRLREWFKHIKFDGPRHINKNSTIRDALVEIRAIQDADRAILFQFHNGDKFVSGESIMKLMMTHVVMKTGISFPIDLYEAGSIPTTHITKTLFELNKSGCIYATMQDDSYLCHMFTAGNIESSIMLQVKSYKDEWIGVLMLVYLQRHVGEINIDDLQAYASKIGQTLSDQPKKIFFGLLKTKN